MSSTNLAHPDKITIRGFFNGIAGRYDFINNLLSFSLDRYWIRKSASLLKHEGQESILDLGVGTGKFLKDFLKDSRWDQVVGLDFSSEMLKEAQQHLPDYVELIEGDFEALPFSEKSFDLIISSFTLRSVQHMNIFLKETLRVLKPSGQVGFLCLTRPKNPVLNLLFQFYMKVYLPLVGRFVSGHLNAYHFLSQSVLNFQEPVETIKMMEQIGFREVRQDSFSLGLATLIRGVKE